MTSDRMIPDDAPGRDKGPLMFFATGFYSGYAPFAPGTFGTLVGLIPALLLVWLASPMVSLLVIAAVIALGIWIAHAAEKQIGETDPGCIVIDEIAGIMVTVWGLPAAWPVIVWTGIGGFIVFRIFDIAKPFPIRYVEKKLPGGAGIMMDDVIAGIIANIILSVLFAVMGL
jgi:phosphatidylglycerophosphatase A